MRILRVVPTVSSLCERQRFSARFYFMGKKLQIGFTTLWTTIWTAVTRIRPLSREVIPKACPMFEMWSSVTSKLEASQQQQPHTSSGSIKGAFLFDILRLHLPFPLRTQGPIDCEECWLGHITYVYCSKNLATFWTNQPHPFEDGWGWFPRSPRKFLKVHTTSHPRLRIVSALITSHLPFLHSQLI